MSKKKTRTKNNRMSNTWSYQGAAYTSAAQMYPQPVGPSPEQQYTNQYQSSVHPAQTQQMSHYSQYYQLYSQPVMSAAPAAGPPSSLAPSSYDTNYNPYNQPPQSVSSYQPLQTFPGTPSTPQAPSQNQTSGASQYVPDGAIPMKSSGTWNPNQPPASEPPSNQPPSSTNRAQSPSNQPSPTKPTSNQPRPTKPRPLQPRPTKPPNSRTTNPSRPSQPGRVEAGRSGGSQTGGWQDQSRPSWEVAGAEPRYGGRPAGGSTGDAGRAPDRGGPDSWQTNQAPASDALQMRQDVDLRTGGPIPRDLSSKQWASPSAQPRPDNNAYAPAPAESGILRAGKRKWGAPVSSPALRSEKSCRCPICNQMVMLDDWVHHATSHGNREKAVVKEPPKPKEIVVVQEAPQFSNLEIHPAPEFVTEHPMLDDLFRSIGMQAASRRTFNCEFCAGGQMAFEDYLIHVQTITHMNNLGRWIGSTGSQGHFLFGNAVPQTPTKGSSKWSEMCFCELCMKYLGPARKTAQLHLKGHAHITVVKKIYEKLDQIVRGEAARREVEQIKQKEQQEIQRQQMRAGQENVRGVMDERRLKAILNSVDKAQPIDDDVMWIEDDHYERGNDRLADHTAHHSAGRRSPLLRSPARSPLLRSPPRSPLLRYPPRSPAQHALLRSPPQQAQRAQYSPDGKNPWQARNKRDRSPLADMAQEFLSMNPLPRASRHFSPSHVGSHRSFSPPPIEIQGGTMRERPSRRDSVMHESRTRGKAEYMKEEQKPAIPVRRKLSPAVLDDEERAALTQKIQATWQGYYHKYYSTADKNPEIVLELQKEYLRSYRGFFKSEPYFQNYYTKVAKPEDLREALILRIDRGSPGPEVRRRTRTPEGRKSRSPGRRRSPKPRGRSPKLRGRSRSPRPRIQDFRAPVRAGREERRSKSPRRRSRSPRRRSPEARRRSRSPRRSSLDRKDRRQRSGDRSEPRWSPPRTAEKRPVPIDHRPESLSRRSDSRERRPDSREQRPDSHEQRSSDLHDQKLLERMSSSRERGKESLRERRPVSHDRGHNVKEGSRISRENSPGSNRQRNYSNERERDPHRDEIIDLTALPESPRIRREESRTRANKAMVDSRAPYTDRNESASNISVVPLLANTQARPTLEDRSLPPPAQPPASRGPNIQAILPPLARSNAHLPRPNRPSMNKPGATLPLPKPKLDPPQAPKPTGVTKPQVVAATTSTPTSKNAQAPNSFATMSTAKSGFEQDPSKLKNPKRPVKPKVNASDPFTPKLEQLTDKPKDGDSNFVKQRASSDPFTPKPVGPNATPRIDSAKAADATSLETHKSIEKTTTVKRGKTSTTYVFQAKPSVNSKPFSPNSKTNSAVNQDLNRNTSETNEIANANNDHPNFNKSIAPSTVTEGADNVKDMEIRNSDEPTLTSRQDGRLDTSSFFQTKADRASTTPVFTSGVSGHVFSKQPTGHRRVSKQAPARGRNLDRRLAPARSTTKESSKSSAARRPVDRDRRKESDTRFASRHDLRGRDRRRSPERKPSPTRPRFQNRSTYPRKSPSPRPKPSAQTSSSITDRLGPPPDRQDKPKEPLFDDPFLSFVHQTLTGIILIGQLQESMMANPGSRELRAKIAEQQGKMHASMTTKSGHVLIRMARCCQDSPISIERLFPDVTPDIAQILRNLEPAVVKLIAATPII